MNGFDGVHCLSLRAERILSEAGVRSLEQLAVLKPRTVFKRKGCGLKTCREILRFRKITFPRTRSRQL